jgi:hypothetical protein
MKKRTKENTKRRNTRKKNTKRTQKKRQLSNRQLVKTTYVGGEDNTALDLLSEGSCEQFLYYVGYNFLYNVCDCRYEIHKNRGPDQRFDNYPLVVNGGESIVRGTTNKPDLYTNIFPKPRYENSGHIPRYNTSFTMGEICCAETCKNKAKKQCDYCLRGYCGNHDKDRGYGSYADVKLYRIYYTGHSGKELNIGNYNVCGYCSTFLNLGQGRSGIGVLQIGPMEGIPIKSAQENRTEKHGAPDSKYLALASTNDTMKRFIDKFIEKHPMYTGIHEDETLPVLRCNMFPRYNVVSMTSDQIKRYNKKPINSIGSRCRYCYSQYNAENTDIFINGDFGNFYIGTFPVCLKCTSVFHINRKLVLTGSE